MTRKPDFAARILSIASQLITLRVADESTDNDERRQQAHSGLIDQKSINGFQHLEKQQYIAVGKITSQYPSIWIESKTGCTSG
jgi:hypothetical protein